MYPESLESDTEGRAREKEVIVQKKSQREIKKAMAYFYGTDQIQRIHNWHECILKDVEG